jgi:hypothetical protein
LNKDGLVVLTETGFLEDIPTGGFLGEMDRDTDRDFSRLALHEAGKSAADGELMDSSSPEHSDFAAEALVGA